MGTKLEGNGMWESSRIILPEHREGIQQWRREQQRRKKPVVDEQAWEEWGRLLQESFSDGRLITISAYDPFEDIEVRGLVSKIDSHQRRILFQHEHLKTWIPFEDIIYVQ